MMNPLQEANDPLFSKTPQARQQAEAEIANIYRELLHMQQEADKKTVAGALDLYYQRSRYLAERHASPTISCYALLIGILYHSGQQDFKISYEYCRQALAFFDHSIFPGSMPLPFIYYQALVCCIRLNLYQEGINMADKGLSLAATESSDWYTLQELRLLLYIQTEHYQAAYIHLQMILSQAGFQRLATAVQENWQIYRAFILMALCSQSEPGSYFRSAGISQGHPHFSQSWQHPSQLLRQAFTSLPQYEDKMAPEKVTMPEALTPSAIILNFSTIKRTFSKLLIWMLAEKARSPAIASMYRPT